MVEVLLALNESSVYRDWLSQLAKAPFTDAVPHAILIGWMLREEVESNRWEGLPRLSNEAYTNFLRQAAKEFGEG